MLYRKTAQAKKISERSEWKTENSLLIASAEQSKLAFEAAQKELKILEIFIQDAKKENRLAFQVLNQALIENTNIEGDFKDENSRTAVIKAIKQGEIFIGKTYDVTNCVDEEHEEHE